MTVTTVTTTTVVVVAGSSTVVVPPGSCYGAQLLQGPGRLQRIFRFGEQMIQPCRIGWDQSINFFLDGNHRPGIVFLFGQIF